MHMLFIVHKQNKSFLLTDGTWLQNRAQDDMSDVGEDWDTQYVTWVWGGLGQSRGGLGHCDNSSFVIEWY